MDLLYSRYPFGGSCYLLPILPIGDHPGDVHHSLSGHRHLEPQWAQIKLQDTGFDPLELRDALYGLACV
jgi:hypothetical protein